VYFYTHYFRLLYDVLHECSISVLYVHLAGTECSEPFIMSPRAVCVQFCLISLSW